MVTPRECQARIPDYSPAFKFYGRKCVDPGRRGDWRRERLLTEDDPCREKCWSGLTKLCRQQLVVNIMKTELFNKSAKSKRSSREVKQ